MSDIRDNTMVEAMFHEQEQKLLKTFQERLHKKELREQLAEVSGIRDEAVLDRLIELNIGPESLAAMEVIPLIFVAWADGQVQKEERAAILEVAQTAGVEPDKGHYPLLEHWLSERPKQNMLDAWKHYVSALCRKLTPDEVEKLRGRIMDRARAVAESHRGGFLGLGRKVSREEQTMLSQLDEAFSQAVSA